MQPVFSTQSFKTAQQNMDFDRTLLKEASQRSASCIRIYKWQTPGITFPDRQTPPHSLSHLDHGHRPTGGGIVFHCPDDIVLCLILPKPSHSSPKLLHTTVTKVAKAIQAAFDSLSITVTLKTQPPQMNDATATPNLAFCKTYFSPNELYYNESKLCGLTLKRYQTLLMIQGIIHLQKTQDHFPNLDPQLSPYFYPHTLPIDPHSLQQVLHHQFSQLIQS